MIECPVISRPPEEHRGPRGDLRDVDLAVAAVLLNICPGGGTHRR